MTAFPTKSEIHAIVYAAVMRALQVGAPGMAAGGRQLAQEQTPKGNSRQ